MFLLKSSPSFQTALRDPRGDSPYRRADVRVTTEDSLHGSSPHAQQSAGCGRPGEVIQVPWTFLDDWNETW